jgi:anti-anti-sigma regulatory factor
MQDQNTPTQRSRIFAEELEAWRQQLIRNVFRFAVVFGAIVVLVGFFATRVPWFRPFYIGIYIGFALLTFLRPGAYRLHAWGSLGLLYGMGVLALLEDGLKGDGRVFMLTLPIMAALLLGREVGLAALGLAALTTMAFIGLYSSGVITIPTEDQIVANDLLSWMSGSLVWGTMAAVAVTSLNFIMRQFASSLTESRRLAHELETHKATLEEQVAKRTEELTAYSEALKEMIDTQKGLLDTIRRMANPVVPLGKGIIVMPLVGIIDVDRAQQIANGLLAGIEQHRARAAILDITGVPVVDTKVANSLLQATKAANLLGTEAILVGLRPEIAETIVNLGVDLGGLITCSDLQQGIDHALR